MRDHLKRLADHAFHQLAPGEQLSLSLHGERSDFVRLDHGRIRQPGTVHQAEVGLHLVQGRHHAVADLSLTGTEADPQRVDQTLDELRALLPALPPDPHLLLATDQPSQVHEGDGAVPDAREILDALLEGARDTDLVGILASGEVFAGFASSWGVSHWDSRPSWVLDFSLFHQGDKAVKTTLGGVGFDPARLRAALLRARQTLAILTRPVQRLSPDRYRVLLAPAAMAELLDLLAWGGFGARARHTRTTALQRMLDGEALSPLVSLAEDAAGGLAPGFSADGFARPHRVALIREGTLGDPLVSPRSAREYDLAPTGVDEDESPTSLSMAPGDLGEDEALSRLGTGLAVSNLWYLNYSDQPAGRVTGMTRFATLWVEGGEVVAPAEVMRFDESVFHLLGEGLEALGDEAALLPDAGTYERRSTASKRVPSALMDGVRFAL